MALVYSLPAADSQFMASAPKTAPDLGEGIWRLMSEFAELNRRRLFGDGTLPPREHKRWSVLRELIEMHFESVGEGGQIRSGTDRRAHPRLPTHIRVRFDGASRSDNASILDISVGGVFVATDSPLATGDPVGLQLEDSDGEKLIQLHGVVSWVRAVGSLGAPGGMGIEFDQLSAAERRAVDRLLSLWTDEAKERN